MFKHIRRRLALTIAITLLTLAALPARAAENDGLITDFGGFGIGGIVTGAPISINAIALQADGKIVAAGVRDNTFALARYSSDGEIDSSFGSNGIVMTTIAPGQQSAVANDLAIQPDGKIVVVGTLTTPGDRDFAVARYDTNGALDPSFSDNGILYAGFAGRDDYAEAVGIDSFERIIVGGTARVGGDYDFAVMSLTSNGLFDTGFGGGDGRATIGFGGDEDAHDLLIQPDGKLVLLGETDDIDGVMGFGHLVAVARFNPNGSLDGSFDGDGKRTSDVGWNYAEAGALDSNSRIIAVGAGFDAVRYNQNGTHDSNFDGDGKLSPPITRNSGANDVVILPDDKILAAGDLDGQIALLRYNFDGSLDRGFDGDGVLLLDILPGASEAASSIVRTPDGRLLVAGGNIIVRLFADGTLDAGGRQLAAPVAEPHIFNRVANATLVQPDGAIVSAGWVHRGDFDYDIALTRHTAAGLSDPTFGTNGERTLGFGATFETGYDAALQPDGKIVVVGNSQLDGQHDSNVLLARFKPDGSGDGSCALFGLTIKDLLNGSADAASNLAIQPADGKILVAGTLVAVGATSATPYVARFDANCGLDTTFSGDGIAPLGFGSSVADVIALPDGKVLLAGSAANFAYLARYNANGSLDTSFGGDGLIPIRVLVYNLYHYHSPY